MTIGNRIRQLRKEQGLSQRELGNRCGMADSAIRRYEADSIKPKTENLVKIIGALGVDATTFMIGLVSPEEISMELDIPVNIVRSALDGSSKVSDEMRSKIIHVATMLASELSSLSCPGDFIAADFVARFSAAQEKEKNEQADRITKYLSLLNDEGQRVAADRVQELTEIPKYQADK